MGIKNFLVSISRSNLNLGLYCTFRPDRYISVGSCQHVFFLNRPIKTIFNLLSKSEILHFFLGFH